MTVQRWRSYCIGLNERLLARRLKGFAEIKMESYHAIQTH